MRTRGFEGRGREVEVDEIDGARLFLLFFFIFARARETKRALSLLHLFAAKIEPDLHTDLNQPEARGPGLQHQSSAREEEEERAKRMSKHHRHRLAFFSFVLSLLFFVHSATLHPSIRLTDLLIVVVRDGGRHRGGELKARKSREGLRGEGKKSDERRRKKRRQ